MIRFVRSSNAEISVIRNRHHDYLNIIRFVLSISETFIADIHAVTQVVRVFCNECLFLFAAIQKKEEKKWLIYY